MYRATCECTQCLHGILTSQKLTCQWAGMWHRLCCVARVTTKFFALADCTMEWHMECYSLCCMYANKRFPLALKFLCRRSYLAVLEEFLWWLAKCRSCQKSKFMLPERRVCWCDFIYPTLPTQRVLGCLKEIDRGSLKNKNYQLIARSTRWVVNFQNLSMKMSLNKEYSTKFQRIFHM